MDFSAFSEDSFDIKEWINSAFKSSEAGSNKDAYASQLVMKLQLFIQEVNSSLEEASQQVLQSLPRIVRDAETLHQECEVLKSQMKMVKEDISKVECSTSQSMHHLLALDEIKSRMQSASKALQEADNWKTLSIDVEDVFQNGDISTISAKIVGMQQCLKILVDIPDYKDRCQHLEDLKNRLEATISPQLIAALNTQSIDAAQIYVKIFRDMERLPQLQKYFHKCQKNQLLRQWRTIVEADTEDTLPEWLANYYDILLSEWHTQVKWCNQVLPDLSAVKIVCELFADVLSNTDPSINFCIESAIKQQAKPLSFLSDLKQITERFCRSLEAAIQVQGSMQCDWVKQLAVVVYAPYKAYVKSYHLHEDRTLQADLNTILLHGGSISHCVRVFLESISKVMSFANEASYRCIQLTNCCAFPDLLKSLKMLFNTYLSRIQKMLAPWLESLRSDDKSETAVEDWISFQQILHAVQSCGEFVIQLEDLDESLAKSLLSCSKKFGTTAPCDRKEPSIFWQFDILLLDEYDWKELGLYVAQVNSGGSSFLSDPKKRAFKLCENFLRIAFDTIVLQIQKHLTKLPNMKVWSQDHPCGALTADLPTYGLSPQEYITQIGQHLMTLPQHIEPFVLQDNRALQVALKQCKLPSISDKEMDDGDNVADILLGVIAGEVTNLYVEIISKLNQLTSYAVKQLATDIDYLTNVLDDLGLRASRDLQEFSILLKSTPEEFKAVSFGKSPKVLNTVRRMRSLKYN